MSALPPAASRSQRATPENLLALFRVKQRSSGFSLIEVALAIGIFAIAIVTMLGLLVPTLESVDEVLTLNQAKGAMTRVNTFLQSPASDPTTASRFEEIYGAVTDQGGALDGGEAGGLWLLQYQYFAANNPDITLNGLAIVGDPNTMGNFNARETRRVGRVFRIELTPSELHDPADLALPVDQFPEGYFAMQVRMFREDVRNGDYEAEPNISAEEAELKEVVTYTAAINR